MITFQCPNCQREARAADEHAGKKAKCPKCAHVFQIPAPGGKVKAPNGSAAPARTKPAPKSSPPPAPPKAATAAPKAPVKKASPPPPEDEDEEDIPDAEEIDDVEEVDEADEVDEEDDEEEERRPRKKKKSKPKKRKVKGRAGSWAPCPNCDSTDANRQYFTLWGSWFGPLIINHVRCSDCGTTYNGIHGDSNNNRILIFLLVVYGPALVIVAGCGILSIVMGGLD